MHGQTEDDVLVKIETADSLLAASALAHFLAGVAIMREAIHLSLAGDRTGFASRLSPMRSLLLWMPEQLVEACGYTWASMGDWPPMDPVMRAAVTQGLLEACDPRQSPVVLAMRPGSLEIVLRDLMKGGRAKLVQALDATRNLMRRSNRPAFKDAMLAILDVDRDLSPSAAGATSMAVSSVPFGSMYRGPGMLAAGAIMFGCQSIERAYSAMGASDIATLPISPGRAPTRGGRKKHARRAHVS